MVNAIIYEGKEYPLSEWITIIEYCKKYDIGNTQTIRNWIRRGKISKEDILEFPELYPMKLVRDKKYLS